MSDAELLERIRARDPDAFDKLWDRHAPYVNGVWVPRSSFAVTAKGAFDLLRILVALYSGRLGRTTAIANAREDRIWELLYNRCRAQSIVGDNRQVVDSLAAIVRLGHFDSRAIANSAGILASAGAFLGFSGLSFGPSHRLLALAREAANPNDNMDTFPCCTMEFVVNYLEGQWDDEHHIDEQSLERGLRLGLLWNADVYLGLLCQQNSYQGKFTEASEQLEKLELLCDSYGYEFARSNIYAERATMLLVQRRLDDALVAAQRWYDQRNEEPLHFMALGLRARALVLQGHLDEASGVLDEADDLVRRSGSRMFPFYSGLYHTARAALETARAELTVEQGAEPTAHEKRRARRTIRRALANARANACDRGDTLRIAGRLEWALGNKNGALNHWAAARAECRRLGALPDLARTLADMGAALEGAEEQWVAKAGISAENCNAEARRIFEKLECQWDLAQLATAGPRRRLRAA